MDAYDKEQALKCFGDEVIFQAAAETFLKEIDSMLDALSDCVSSQVFSDIKDKAHWIKGGLVYLHAKPSAAAAKNLEDAAKNKDSNDVDCCLTKLNKEIEKLKSSLVSSLSL